MKRNKKAWVPFLLVCAVPLAHADMLRCGEYLIDVDDLAQDVLERCGEPTARDGFYWVYDRGEAGKTTLRVVDGQVRDIVAGNPF